jgi:hypothetical protein
MRILLITLSLSSILLTAACADQNVEQKQSWLCCDIPPLEWPRDHWEGQSFQPHMQSPDHQLPAALDRSRSMFDAADIENTDPEDFIHNLKNAQIIDRIYTKRSWLDYNLKGNQKYEGRQTGPGMYDVLGRGHLIAALDYNFYTLSKADQVVITELLLQSYDTDFIILKDTHTHKTVGTITPRGFELY